MEKIADVKFKELLSRLQKELLKQQGFRKNGNNFRKYHQDGTCKILNFQKSMYNSDGQCAFTMNLGIYFQQDPENPNLMFKEYECVVRTRVQGISELYSQDKWWKITDTADMEGMYLELMILLRDEILPWLDQFETRGDVILAKQRGALKGAVIWGQLA